MNRLQFPQSFGLCGRGRRWVDLGEWHGNMYNIVYEASFNLTDAVTVCSDFEAKKRKSVTPSTFAPSICHEVMGLNVP